MSLEVRIPKEITEYTEKIIFGLSIRQLFCFVLAITLGITTYLFARLHLGTRAAGYLTMVIVLPLFAVGFLRKNGFPFEKYAALLLRHKFGTHKRTYHTKLLIDMVPKSEKEVKKSHVFQETGNKRECEVFESTEKSRKRKCKETKRKIKTAIKEYRQAKRATKKAIKETKKTNNRTRNDKISTNV